MTRLVVKLTCGTEALERTNQALTVASSALASGVEVSMWLTGEAVWFATPGFADTVALEGAQSFADAVSLLLAEGTLTVCSQCLSRRALDAGALIPGVRIAGAASFVEEIIAPDTQALVY